MRMTAFFQAGQDSSRVMRGLVKIDLDVPSGQLEKYRALLLEHGALRVLAL